MVIFRSCSISSSYGLFIAYAMVIYTAIAILVSCSICSLISHLIVI